jgi:hypothetical protein
MTQPWGTARPEPSRRAADTASTRPRNSQFPKPLTRAERDRFVVKLMARLPASDEAPVSTRELGDYFELDPYLRNNLLWATLDRLAREGLVERVVRDREVVRYWRRNSPVGGQDQGEEGAAQ